MSVSILRAQSELMKGKRMSRVRIIKKNDEYTSEYQVGDIFQITGTWYGGVHIVGKSGIPVSLDREEYMELDTEPEPEEEETVRGISERGTLYSTLSGNGYQSTQQNICIRYLRLPSTQRRERSW